MEQNELQTTLIKTFALTSFVMGYRVYNDLLTLVQREKLKVIIESKNIEDKFAVATIKIEKHLPREKARGFSVAVSYIFISS